MPHLEPSPGISTRRRLYSRPFSCELRFSGRAAVWVRASGELDGASAPQFKRAVDEAMRASVLVVVDLRGLTFIDGDGIHVVVDADARARRSARRLIFVRARGPIDRLFALLGVADRLETVDLRPVLAFSQAATAPAAADAT